MNYTIVDCYTDEPAGLGVPPYLGTYPRYIYGKLRAEGHTVRYLTIDDMRLHFDYGGEVPDTPLSGKTNIKVYNRTEGSTKKVLSQTDVFVIILGVHVPGKYLSAVPGTLHEIVKIFEQLPRKKILTGPAVFGTQLEGGKFYEKEDMRVFDEVRQFGFEFGNFDKLQPYALQGTELIEHIPDYRIIEIETGRGCNVGKCSFCTEPLKNMYVNRKTEHIIQEIKAFYDRGCRYFRLGKQSDFYSVEDPVRLLKGIRKAAPDIKVLHLDNVNPVFVVGKGGVEKTKAVVKYCTPGNIAAFGVESFDPEVVKHNKLNCKPIVAMKAIEILNEHGAQRGDNGMPTYLPGINIIFGLGHESKKTHRHNMDSLKKIYDNGWMLRRINVRQVAILPNTMLEKEFGNKYLRKNKKRYWSWRNDIRQQIDFPMLKRIVPEGTVLKNVYTEVYDGKTTFGRQIGTYPLIVGIKGRLPLKQFFDVEITDHMLRSVTGVVSK